MAFLAIGFTKAVAAADQGMSRLSPLKAKPLRVPGQSVDEQIDYWLNDHFMDYAFAAGALCILAVMEWIGYLFHTPRYRVLLSVVAGIAVAVMVWRAVMIRRKIKVLRLGRDGERAVGQYLERLRKTGADVLHDIPGDEFNLDHVVISTRGIFAIETKTWTKPWPKATITVHGDQLLVAGKAPDRNPIEQVSAAARWLKQLLAESTGKQFSVRGVVVFPRWWIEQRSPRGAVWVLEPKALPVFIQNEPEIITPSEVALASSHLSRYVRSLADKAA
jgi:hypothetical protein